MSDFLRRIALEVVFQMKNQEGYEKALEQFQSEFSKEDVPENVSDKTKREIKLEDPERHEVLRFEDALQENWVPYDKRG